MAYDVQICIDSGDPHVLADWWAEALGWEVESQDEAFIRDMIAKGHASEADTVVHRGELRWKPGVAIRNPGSPRVLFQLVPEKKTVKNRVHLDIRVGAEKIEAEVERLVAKGATVLHHGRQGPHSWITIADPEGNELCVCSD
ncbi:hypothetical protein SAMN05421505_10317 [Sinosporangium album]|uniref:VOC domain-containing protein n=1 Tax=Sinosporangium album TaxID=504805 RepID=A0A1G7SYU9_9ACTN|nr:VOC family protein [Sinosporangium album]SDG27954.1 hypothetical protein SAMN05421505_10317 [Sinosporangium album]